MKETCPGDVRYRRSHLLTCMNDVYTKGVDGIASNIVTVNSRDQNFALMIIHKQSSDHFAILPDTTGMINLKRFQELASASSSSADNNN